MEWQPLLKALARTALAAPIAAPLRATLSGPRRRGRAGYWSRQPRAAYYWNVWAKHFALAAALGMGELPEAVAEFGPGDSSAAGLSALLCGVQHYRGFDAAHYVNPERDAALLDQLRRLSLSDFAVPQGWPSLDHCLAEGTAARQMLAGGAISVGDDRVKVLREALASSLVSSYDADDNAPLRVIAPWQASRALLKPRFDLVFSHSVAQYLPDLSFFFSACAALLRPGGWTTHQIDLSSMDITRHVNGHLAYPNAAWRLVTAHRPFFPNRKLLSDYLSSIEASGLELVHVDEFTSDDALPPEALARNFQGFSARDVKCIGAFVVARKPGVKSRT